MSQSTASPKENWFQRNPKKTLALVTGLALLLIVFAG